MKNVNCFNSYFTLYFYFTSSFGFLTVFQVRQYGSSNVRLKQDFDNVFLKYRCEFTHQCEKYLLWYFEFHCTLNSRKFALIERLSICNSKQHVFGLHPSKYKFRVAENSDFEVWTGSTNHHLWRDFLHDGLPATQSRMRPYVL